jgi:hypothetical protein
VALQSFESASRRRSESLGWIFLQKKVQQILKGRREPIPRFEGLMHNVIHSDHVGSVVEGWNSHCHFVDKNAECPPINHFVVPTLKDHFRSEVLSCATQSICLFS